MLDFLKNKWKNLFGKDENLPEKTEEHFTEEEVYKTALPTTDKTTTNQPIQDNKTGRNVQNNTFNNIYQNDKKDEDKEITNIPTRNSESLIGRAEMLERLRRELKKNKEVVLLNAMGGMGKTALAETYTFKYYNEYDKMIWLSNPDESEDPRSVFVTNKDLIKHYKIDAENKKAPEIFNEICGKMRNEPGERKLIVLDNFNQKIEPFLNILPKQPNWHVLFTSRQKISDFKDVELDFLEPDDAFIMFESYYEKTLSENEKILIPLLLKRFEYHTLTIEILAKAMRKQRHDMDTMIDALGKNIAVNDKTRHSGGKKIDRIKSYLVEIFSIVALNEDEKQLLKQFVCLPGDYIKFYSKKEEDNLCHILLADTETAETKSKLSNDLTELHEKGWLMYNAVKEEYKMHPVVKEVLSEILNLQQEEVIDLIIKITRLLKVDQTKDNPVDKFKWAPFGTAILKQIQESTSEIARLQNNLALGLKDAGEYLGAKKYLEKSLILIEKLLGPNHSETSIRYSNLALALQDLGDYSQAKKYLEKALKSDEKNFGPEHPTTAVSYSNLALALQDLGDYSQAKKYLEKALKSDEKNFGPQHPNTAVSYSNLALALQDLGDYSQAKKYLEKALKSDEKNFGPQHPNTARCYSNLALVLQDLGDYAQAKNYLEKALKSAEKNFGPQHPNTARCYSNLALVLKDLGDYAQAKNYLEKALKSAEKNFGPQHPNTARCYSNLATLLYYLEKYKLAFVYIQKAKNVFQKVLPEGHPHLKIVEEWYEIIKKEV